MRTTNFFKNTLKFAFAASALFFVSCGGDDNSLIETPIDTETENPVTQEPTPTVIVTNLNADTNEREVEFTAEANTTTPVIIKFSDADNTMNRMYITQTLSGTNEGPTPYEIDPNDNLGLSKKTDNSLDLEGDQEESFNFTINFPTPATDGGTVQYVIWTTKQRGDYRDISNDNSFDDYAYALITITAGKTKASFSGFREFEKTIKLDAPLADATSETFISLFDSNVHKISEGEESAALWDFGYFYDKDFGASFYSVSTFPSSGFTKSIKEITGLERSQLNKCYFGKSTKTIEEFDAISTAAELDNNLTTDSKQDTSSFIASNALEIGDVVEFLDQYGNKGLIKIIGLVKSAGSTGEITFDVKVQTNALPIEL